MQDFLAKHKLLDSYAQIAHRHFDPLVQTLIDTRQDSGKATFYIVVSGCQGSGKTTLSDYVVYQLQKAGFSACAISIDDFYLTRPERQDASENIHPLLLTRGVPGTHDMVLAKQTLVALTENASVNIPRFSKAIDDHFPENDWDCVTAPLDFVILEGWCVAVPAQNDEQLRNPINDLERKYDSDGNWRQYSNECLKKTYDIVWQLFDYKVMLKAPSFDNVYRWRLEQENKLREKILPNGGDANAVMSPEQIRDFIAYYERLTRHALDVLPAQCDTVFTLDDNRQIG